MRTGPIILIAIAGLAILVIAALYARGGDDDAEPDTTPGEAVTGLENESLETT